MTAENRQLRRELEEARDRVAELEAAVARLTRALEAVGRGADEEPEQPPEPASVDESVPSASPRALFRALVESNEEALAGESIGHPGDRDRANYLRQLGQWRTRVQREHRSIIEWHVRVVAADPVAAGYVMRLVAIDPVNEVRLGEPFAVTIPRAHARRYEQLAARGDVGPFVLRGTLVPAITINEARSTPGPFDNPPLIGPFAEFGFTIEPRAFMPAGEE